MLMYKAKRLHQEDRNFIYQLLFSDGSGLMSMGDDNEGNVYFFTREPLPYSSKKSLGEKGIRLDYEEMEESLSQDTKSK